MRLLTMAAFRSSSRTNTCRSEEHTSELQSRLHLVCRLLLEKKKIHIETARRIQYLERRSESSLFVCICSYLTSLANINKYCAGKFRLYHAAAFTMRTKAPDV